MRHCPESADGRDRDPLQRYRNRDKGRFTTDPDLLRSLFNERPARSGGSWRESFGLVSAGRPGRRPLPRSSTA